MGRNCQQISAEAWLRFARLRPSFALHGLMANQTQPESRPRRIRVPSERARGLEPEVTAQPHSYVRELGVATREEPGLSVDPEDLGNHFLTEAVEQGDLMARDAADLELAMLGDPESEDRPSVELSVWSRMVDLAADGGSPSQQLQAAAAFGADALEADRGTGPAELEAESEFDEDTSAIRLTDSAIRDRSLLDQEGPGFDEVVSPEVEAEDGGRHARSTPGDALGGKARGASEPARRGVRARGRQLQTTARSKLSKAAGQVRALARRISRKAKKR